MNDPILEFKRGNGSMDEALVAALEKYYGPVKHAVIQCRRLGVSPSEARSATEHAMWQVLELWDPTKGTSLLTYTYRYLTGLAKNYFRIGKPSSKIQQATMLYGEKPPLSAAAPLGYPNLDQRDLRELVGEETLRKALFELFVGGYGYRQAIKHVLVLAPETNRRKLRETARELRNKISKHVSTYYPTLIGATKETPMVNDTTTPAAEAAKTTTPPPPKAADGKEAAADPKTASKTNGTKPAAKPKAAPKKAAAKPPAKAAPKKAAAKPASKPAAKPKAAPKKAATKPPAKAKGKGIDEKKLLEADDPDIRDRVKKINDLLASQEQAEVGNDWKIGRELCTIRESVNDGTWGKIIVDELRGIGARVLKKSSLEKKMKLFRCFPKNEKRAVAIGVGRNDVLCRIPIASVVEEKGADGKVIKRKLRDVVIEEGWTTKDGKTIKVEDLNVSDLSKKIDKILKANGHTDRVRSPADLFTAGFLSLKKGFSKLFETHQATIATTIFSAEQGAAIEAAAKELVETVGTLEGLKIAQPQLEGEKGKGEGAKTGS
jgi:hypothetical protein